MTDDKAAAISVIAATLRKSERQDVSADTKARWVFGDLAAAGFVVEVSPRERKRRDRLANFMQREAGYHVD